ncbi:MAG: transcriptional repressor [Candidatus Limnocylindrales bacterium]
METEQIEQRIRATGRRMTRQRRAVLAAVQRSRHHVTADEIATRVRATHPRIDPSTVYRNLEALEAIGLVSHSHLEDRITRWHRADVERHGHLVCRSCGEETELPAAALAGFERRLEAAHAFIADLGHSAIVGICRACALVPSE